MSPRVHRALIPFAAAGLLAGPAQAQRVTEVQIAPPFMRMVQDAQAQLSATAYDGDGNPVTVRFRWSSSNINIATVATDGTVHAIMPGTVLITVTAEAEGRRPIVARASVFVLRPGQRPPPPMRVYVMPPPSARPITPKTLVTPTTPQAAPAPAAPPAGTMPPSAMPPGAMAPAPPAPPGGAMPPSGTMPPALPGMKPGEFDSLMRASINCGEPFMNATNPMHACWDTRAEMRDSAFPTPERPGLDRCPQGVSTVIMLIQVNERGGVDGVLPFEGPSVCPDFTRAAVEAARRLSFVPAQRGGQPVRSWVRLRVRPE